MENFVVASEFFAFCARQGMDVRASRGFIRADVAFETNRGFREGEALLQLSQHAGDDDQVKIVTSEDFEPTEVPFSHWARSRNTWSTERDRLTIKGRHPTHGSYTIIFRYLSPGSVI